MSKWLINRPLVRMAVTKIILGFMLSDVPGMVPASKKLNSDSKIAGKIASTMSPKLTKSAMRGSDFMTVLRE